MRLKSEQCLQRLGLGEQSCSDGVWVDGTQSFNSGPALASNPVAGFGSQAMGGGEDYQPGLTLFENLTYSRGRYRTLGSEEAVPPGGTPVVRVYQFDGPRPVKANEPFSNGTSQQCLNNVEDGTRYVATEDGQIGIADLLTLVDGRRMTGHVVRAGVDEVSYDAEGTRSIVDPMPGVVYALHFDAVGDFTPFERTDAIAAIELPVFGSPTGSFDSTAIYNLDGLPTCQDGLNTGFTDLSTGFLATIGSGAQVDKSTAAVINPEAGDKTPPPLVDDVVIGPDLPPPSSCKEPTTLERYFWWWRRWLWANPMPSHGASARHREYWIGHLKEFIAYMKRMRVGVFCKEDQERYQRDLAEAESALQQWEGEPAPSTTSRGGRRRGPDDVTEATNDNMSPAEVEEFHEGEKGYTEEVDRTRTSIAERVIYWRSATLLRAVADSPDPWGMDPTGEMRRIARETDAFLRTTFTGWRPAWIPRHVGVVGTTRLYIGVGVTVGCNLNVDLDDICGPNNGLYGVGSYGTGFERSSGLSG